MLLYYLACSRRYRSLYVRRCTNLRKRPRRPTVYTVLASPLYRACASRVRHSLDAARRGGERLTEARGAHPSGRPGHRHRGNAARSRLSMRPRGHAHGRPRNHSLFRSFPRSPSSSSPRSFTRARLHAHALTIICQNICDMPDTHAHRRPQTEGPSVCRTLFGGRLPPGVLSQEREGPA